MRERAIRTGLVLALAASVASVAANPLADPTTADLERLRPASGNLVMVEFYDKERRKVDVATFAVATPPRPGASNSIAVTATQAIRLWGISACPHDRVLIEVNFDGPCNRYISHGLDKILRSGPVMLCRAFSDQRGRQEIDASCFILTTYASLYTVTKIEEFLISGGYALLARDASVKALRPDLEDDERIAKGFGRGLWSFEHERVRRGPRN